MAKHKKDKNCDTFICDLCGSRFNRKFNLERHQSSIHGQEIKGSTQEKAHKCELCSCQYKNKISLTRHKLKCHASDQLHLTTRKKKKKGGNNDEMPQNLESYKSKLQVALFVIIFYGM